MTIDTIFGWTFLVGIVALFLIACLWRAYVGRDHEEEPERPVD